MSEIIDGKEEVKKEVKEEAGGEGFGTPVHLQFLGVVEANLLLLPAPTYAFVMVDSNKQHYVAEFQCQPNYMKGIIKALQRMRFIPIQSGEKEAEKKMGEAADAKISKILSAGDNDV